MKSKNHGDGVFHLLKGEEIEVLEADKYNRVRVQMHRKSVTCERCLTALRDGKQPAPTVVAYPEETVNVHYMVDRPVVGEGWILGAMPLCGSLTVRERDRI